MIGHITLLQSRADLAWYTRQLQAEHYAKLRAAAIRYVKERYPEQYARKLKSASGQMGLFDMTPPAIPTLPGAAVQDPEHPRAPAGGTTVAGEQFVGGQWVPKEKVEEVAAETGKSKEQVAGEIAQGQDPAAGGLTFDQFRQQYQDLFKSANKYKPNEIGFSTFSERMATLSDQYPEWAEQVENEGAPGAAEVQPEPPEPTPEKEPPAAVVRHGIDVDAKTVKTNALQPSLSAGAFKGVNTVWHHQGDPQHLVWSAADKDMASDYKTKKVNELFAAQEAGYKLKNYRAGKYGTLWVMEKDGRILTERGAAALVSGVGNLDVQPQSGRENAKSLIDPLNTFIASLPETTQTNLGALSRAIKSSPLGSHVVLARENNGQLRLSDTDRTWHVHEPAGTSQQPLESDLQRFLAKIDYLATHDMPDEQDGWVMHDRAADEYAIGQVPAGGAQEVQPSPVEVPPEPVAPASTLTPDEQAKYDAYKQSMEQIKLTPRSPEEWATNMRAVEERRRAKEKPTEAVAEEPVAEESTEQEPQSSEDILRAYAQAVHDHTEDPTNETADRISTLRRQYREATGKTTADQDSEPYKIHRDIKDIARDVKKIESRLEAGNASYRPALSGGTRASSTTFTANQGKNAQLLKAYRDELKSAASAALASGMDVPPDVLARFPELQSPVDEPDPKEQQPGAEVNPESPAEPPADTDSEPELPAEPEEPPTPAAAVGEPLKPYAALKDWMDIHNKITDGDMTAAQLKAEYQRYRDSAEPIKAVLNGWKVGQLRNFSGRLGNWHAKSMNKGELINRIYSDLGHSFLVQEEGFTWSPTQETHEEATQRYVDKTTDEDIAAHGDRGKAARAKREVERGEVSKALENPETPEEFKTFVDRKGESALSPEHRAKWDEIQAEQRRERDKAKASVVQQVAPVEGLSMEIKQGFHAKKGKPTYVAVLNQRVDREMYDRLNQAAKSLGGYYSAFKGGGAVPGFQFDTPEAAEKFKGVLSGKVDRTEELAQRDVGRQESRVGSLRERADALKQRAEEQLAQERLTNTARRAGMAAGADARARSDVSKAVTMSKLADKIDTGEAKHLNGVKAGTDIDTLNSMLHRARWERYRTLENKSGTNYEQFIEMPHTEADVAAVEYPYPRIWSRELRDHAKSLENTSGLMLVAQRLRKKAEEAGPTYRKTGNKFTLSPAGLSAADKIGENSIRHLVPEDKRIRIHSSTDWKLRDAATQHGVKKLYTADGGKSWGINPDSSIAAAINRGNKLDLVDPPEEQLLTIDDPRDIEQLRSAVAKLKRNPDRTLQRIGESFKEDLEHHDRLQRMDIKTAPELRAALREYLSVKTEREREDPIKAKERSLIGRKIEDFFPTPRPIIDQMLDAADIQPGMTVLEPSAGKGDILDAVTERHPEAKTHAIEPVSDLREILEAKGHSLVDRDFTEHPTDMKYDRIVMNPPFSKGQDIAHVQKAYEHLAPGGRLVAIMAGGGTGKRQQFDDWVHEHGGTVEELPQGSFAGSDAFRQTGVNTKLVTIDKWGEKAEQFSRLRQDVIRYVREKHPQFYAMP